MNCIQLSFFSNDTSFWRRIDGRLYTNAFEYSVCSLVFVYECVEGESVAPGGSEVVDVDVAVSGRALAHPGEQRALHVALAQLSHHVL